MTETPPIEAQPRVPWRRLTLFSLLFLGLTAAGLYVVYDQFAGRNLTFDPRLIQPGTVAAIVGLLLVYFGADGLRLYFTLLFNFAAVSIDGLQIHNRRGADTLGHFGMAHATAKLSAGTSATSGEDGLSIHDVEFRADIDMPVFRMGGTAIGSVSFTDFAITNTSMMVYGH